MLPGAELTGLSFGGLFWAALLAIPLLVQISAALILLAANVPDYKTGQFIATPAMLLAMLPAAVSVLPGISLSPLLALIPITNVVLTTQEVMLSSPRWGLVLLAFVITVLHTGGLLWVGAKKLNQESTVFGAESSTARHARGQYGPEAMGLFALALVLFWFLGQISMQWDMVSGIVFTQVFLIALPAIAIIRWLGLPLKETLQLRRPSARDLSLAILAGCMAPSIGTLIFQAQEFLIPVSDETLSQFAESLDLDMSLGMTVLIIAVFPAVCEEVLFRGAILGLLRKQMGPVARCVLVAALFGLLHLMLIRILPTATLGLLLTAAAMRSRSLWIPIVIHLLNNGIAITLVELVGEGPESLGVPAVLMCAAVGIAAVALMGRGSETEDCP